MTAYTALGMTRVDHHRQPATWAAAATATLHCLTGCAIGEVVSMVIGTTAGLGG
jgi:hypothetical protein